MANVETFVLECVLPCRGSRLKLSVIIPVHNGGDNLRCCLDALASSSRLADEYIVVDDNSTDGSAETARTAGARVVGLSGGSCGPAFARNRGAEIAVGDVLVFLDADVMVHPDTLGRIDRCLFDHAEIAAIFGSYDAQPTGRSIVSRYKNLLHCYVHQHARREAFTFWAGCGAIRREVFSAAGGFDERYGRPSIEDIELGARLKRAGYRIWLLSDIQVKHLKEWTLVGLLQTDIRDRAIPWSRLLVHEKAIPADLNLDTRSRQSAVSAWICLLSLCLGFFFAWVWLIALAAALALLALNGDLYRFFARQGGIGFALSAVGLHTLYLLYSSMVFGLILGPNLVIGVFRS